MKRLVAGPWYGEFGWELMSWQGHLRALAENYDEVTVCGPTGHSALYQDFADKFIPHSIQGAKDCWKTSKDQKDSIATVVADMKSLGGQYVEPAGFVPIAKQKFIQYGTKDSVKTEFIFDVLVHARGRFGRGADRAWEPPHCDQVVKRLLKAGYKVGAIGTQAYRPEGATDCRSFDLQILMNIMRSAKLVIGPSSGPMHLASLCGTPHLVWTDTKRYSAIRGTNRMRYQAIWNPLHTPVYILDKFGWRPSVEAVSSFTEEILQKWKPPQLLTK